MRSGKVRGALESLLVDDQAERILDLKLEHLEGTSKPESEAAIERALEASKAKAKETAIQDERDLTMVDVLHKLSYSIIETLGDGQCFFNAVAKELSLGNIDGIKAIKTSHPRVRQDVVTWMRNNQVAWKGFLTEADETPEERLARMAKPLEYAEHLELTAMSSILKR